MSDDSEEEIRRWVREQTGERTDEDPAPESDRPAEPAHTLSSRLEPADDSDSSQAIGVDASEPEPASPLVEAQMDTAVETEDGDGTQQASEQEADDDAGSGDASGEKMEDDERAHQPDATSSRQQQGAADEPNAGETASEDEPGQQPESDDDVTDQEPSGARERVVPDEDTKEFLKRIKQQEKMRIKQEMAEADALETKAKAMAKKAKRDQKVQAKIRKHEDVVARMGPEHGFDPQRPITEIPKITDTNVKQVEFTTVQEGRAYLRIVFNSASNRYTYETIEPVLSSTETQVFEFLTDTLIRTMDGRDSLLGDPEDYLVSSVERAILDHSIIVDEISKQKILYFIIRDFVGYGPIDVFMRDPMIEDISCDGPDVPLYIFHRQYESIRSTVKFPDDITLDSFVIRLAQRSGKHISIAEPLLDATLPDTSRLQCSLSREVTTRGSSFTIRKFRSDPLTPPDLVRLGTFSAEMAAYFWFSMEEGFSLVYAGGTASGKTTSLNAICQFIPPDKKIVSIEDTREINLRHENWIAGLTRAGFGGELIGGKPAGTIDMYKLLEAALRQRPEYLIVGEVRGKEALTLFQAMATGHATYSTLHADSVRSAVYRLENEPINVPRIMVQTLNSCAIQAQVRMKDRMVRRVKHIVELVGIDAETGDLLTNSVFEWDPATDKTEFIGRSNVFELIQEKKNMTAAEVMDEWQNRARVIQWMADKGIRQIDDVADIISEYYRKPEVLLQRIDDGATASDEDVAPPEEEITSAA